MRSGFNGVDFEANVNFDRLRKERLDRVKAALKESGMGAILCYDYDNIRYICGTHSGEWGRDKLTRHCLLIDGADQPIHFDTAAPAKRQRVPWIRPENIMPAVGTLRGAMNPELRMPEREAEKIYKYLRDHGVENRPLGIDICEIPIYKSLEKQGIEVVDCQEMMVECRLIKTPDEIEMLKCSAAMVDAAYYDIAKALRPGVTENELSALMHYKLLGWGAERVGFVNVISGARGNPHCHVTSNRMVRPGELVFLDVGNSYNGYRTCYYRTFSCGVPTKAQEEAYAKAYKWITDAIDKIRPGNTTADVAAAFPPATDLGFANEEDAFMLQYAHGIGLGLWERPIISRHTSFDYPQELRPGMVFAIETWCASEDGSGSARIEEEIVVTETGHEVISKFPSDRLTSCGLPGCMFL